MQSNREALEKDAHRNCCPVPFDPNHLRECPLIRHYPGHMVQIVFPNGYVTSVPTESIVRTKGSAIALNSIASREEYDPTLPAQRGLPRACMHFVSQKVCLRGRRCFFLHIVGSETSPREAAKGSPTEASTSPPALREETHPMPQLFVPTAFQAPGPRGITITSGGPGSNVGLGHFSMQAQPQMFLMSAQHPQSFMQSQLAPQFLASTLGGSQGMQLSQFLTSSTAGAPMFMSNSNSFTTTAVTPQQLSAPMFVSNYFPMHAPQPQHGFVRQAPGS